MTAATVDPFSVAGKAPPVDEQVQLLVIGCGPAGLAAAIAAAEAGLGVVLVDEYPVPAEAMACDIPLHFGGRASGAARNRNAMMEAMLDAFPRLAEAMEAGVDVRLGTEVWGLFANGPSVQWLPGRVAGLTDGTRAWLLGVQRVIVAAGRRDMGLGFPGWSHPGVMGAAAAMRLAALGALDSRRAVVLGSTQEGIAAANALRGAGVEIAAIVEPLPAAVTAKVTTSPDVMVRSMIAGVASGPDGVTAAEIVALDEDGRRLPGTGRRIACDTIVLAIGAVPVVELLDAAGCRIVFDADRGGHVPATDAAHRTSLPWLFAVGDCAGIWAAKTADAGIAAREGAEAAAQAAADLARSQSPPPREPPPPAAFDVGSYRLLWTRSAVIDADEDTEICQCEGVTVRDILDLRPPRYLGVEPRLHNQPPLEALLASPPHPDQVKRLTRAGMGLCQGRRCREQVACLLALASDRPVGEIPLASYRAPVRPMPLSVAATLLQSPAMAQGWDTWFAIPGQMIGYWEIPKNER